MTEPEDPIAEARRLLADVGAKRLTDSGATAETALRLLAALCDRLEAAERGDNCPRCEEVQCGACGGTGQHWNPLYGWFDETCYSCKGEGVLSRWRE